VPVQVSDKVPCDGHAVPSDPHGPGRRDPGDCGGAKDEGTGGGSGWDCGQKRIDFNFLKLFLVQFRAYLRES
jgi:hypothetical protein